MDFSTEDERAKAALAVERGMTSKLLNKIIKHQIKLTIIQYAISFIIFIIGICFYTFLNTFNLKLGSISINDISIHDLNINIGTILILVSLYMLMRITLDLNIRLFKGEE